ncbi:YbaN family protein [Peteryoungia desertarenae]|uniref:YbaN family protein n=1 Tax=Peteryoungia desertarenae TaxID=1813451 RepID=A0ABX6QLL1_9HYPH|nr:YbaN family protein [Peteryoungia desertarenae]QLF69438.1 YbaN family protein [Peteryoungia desertarenae]
MRLILFVLAWLMVAIGIIGVFLPVLPTTPFMLLAAALFARSSPRFEQWLLDHPRYGQPLIDWRREGAISKRAKIASVSLMSVSYGIVWFVGPHQLWLKIVIGAILVACATFVLTRPLPGTADRVLPVDS